MLDDEIQAPHRILAIGATMSLIKLNNVCLDYIVKSGSESIKKSAINLVHNVIQKSAEKQRVIKHSSYRVLNNINLEIKTGDRVGILGRNGAGKSTLLRMLANIYKPSLGTLHVDGKISNLFDVKLGMNIEATGYENIVNLSIMRGHSKKVARNMIPDIETFTELDEFLNQPVRTYSTGMQMKLAFAVATSICPEIMLIDEIIGAGDSHFMKKATQRLEQMIEQSNILVLTSHSNAIIKRFCNKVIVLGHGEIQFEGDVEEGIKYYTQGSDQLEQPTKQKDEEQLDELEIA